MTAAENTIHSNKNGVEKDKVVLGGGSSLVRRRRRTDRVRLGSTPWRLHEYAAEVTQVKGV